MWRFCTDFVQILYSTQVPDFSRPDSSTTALRVLRVRRTSDTHKLLLLLATWNMYLFFHQQQFTRPWGYFLVAHSHETPAISSCIKHTCAGGAGPFLRCSLISNSNIIFLSSHVLDFQASVPTTFGLVLCFFPDFFASMSGAIHHGSTLLSSCFKTGIPAGLFTTPLKFPAHSSSTSSPR